MQTADDHREVTSQVLSSILVLYIFKLVSYFNRIIICSQTKYYLPTNREGFSADTVWLLQTWFADWLSALISACY